MGAPQRTRLTAADRAPTLNDAMETVWHKGVVKIYPVTDSKLEELTAGYNSLYLIFFGIFAGAGISFLIAFETAVVADKKPYYVGACISTLGVAILFGIVGITNYVRASRAKAKLYQDSIPLEPKA
jgi:hypothetical protein